MAKLTFLGAAGCVTGSKYLVEAAGKRLLVDCGIFQGTQELQDRNYKPLPVDPKTIDYLVLTHAHLDHSGWLPVLVKSGYRGPIYANPATIELTTILLKDSAHIQEEDTLHARIHKDSRHTDPLPLYTSEDVEPTLKLIKSMPRSGAFDISPEFRVTSYDAGHILGSSSLELTITEAGKKTVVVFSGDIGRYNQPILKDPATPPSKADVLICESTYGDREHPVGDAAELLAQIVNRVVKRGGSIVIPSFAIGRTQTFMYYLRQLEDQQRIPHLPVYVDSPMALDATDLYLKHKEDHDLEYVREEGSDGKGDPLNVHEFHLTRSVEESKAINNVKTPCIIISASGIVRGGRWFHHLGRLNDDAGGLDVIDRFRFIHRPRQMEFMNIQRIPFTVATFFPHVLQVVIFLVLQIQVRRAQRHWAVHINGYARYPLLVFQLTQVVHKRLRPSDGERRNHNRSAALHYTIHDLRQHFRGVAVRMFAIAIR